MIYNKSMPNSLYKTKVNSKSNLNKFWLNEIKFKNKSKKQVFVYMEPNNNLHKIKWLIKKHMTIIISFKNLEFRLNKN
jgi:hypothetical protein